MKRKYNTLNEEIYRMKSLFGESRLYGNLVTEDTEPSPDKVKEVMEPIKTEALKLLSDWKIYNAGLKVRDGLRFVGKSKIKSEIEKSEDIIDNIDSKDFCSDSTLSKIESNRKNLKEKEEEYRDILTSKDKEFISSLKQKMNLLKSECQRLKSETNTEEVIDNTKEADVTDDKPDYWYENPVDVLKKYGVPEDVIGNMESDCDDEKCSWEYQDSKINVRVNVRRPIDYDKPAYWLKIQFVNNGDIDGFWVGKLLYVWDIGEENESQNVTEGKLFKHYLLDGKYNDLLYASDYGVEDGTSGEIKNGYITIGDETTDPFRVGGEIVDSEDDEIYKKVQELRSGNAEEVKTDIDIATDNTTDEKEVQTGEKPKMMVDDEEKDIIYTSPKLNKDFNIGKFVHDKSKDEFKIKSKYPFLLTRTNNLVERTEDAFWKTLSKWYDKPLNSDNTTLDIINDKKFKVKIK
jgi:hypothetical protein